MTRRIFVIGSGQSNALGGEGGEGGDQTVNSRVKIWNSTGWITATLGVAPFATGTNPPRNNAVWNFCKKLQETQDADVYMVLVARGNTPISWWKPNVGEMWTTLNSYCLAAMASDELNGKLPDYFVWFQGEADGSNSQYRNNFLEFRTAAISAGWLKEDTPVIMGEILNDKAKSKAQMYIMAKEFDWLTIAANEGCQRVGPSSAHFTGDGYVEYGRKNMYWASQTPPSVKDKYKGRVK